MNTTTRKDTDKARDEANTATEKVKDAGSQVGQALSGATEKVKDAATHAGQAVTSAASAVGHKADDLAGSAGSGARSLADTVRHQGPREGMLGSATGAVADALEQGGKYLEKNKLSGMAEDVTEMIRRNPLPALLVGVGVGFLLGRACSRS